jgi:hypothetical protein
MSINKPYYLLLIPLVLAFFAAAGYGFFFKAAVTGSCIAILLFLYRNLLKRMPDIWFVIAAFFLSIAGDWFLSNKGDSLMTFSAGIGFYFMAHVGYLWFAMRNGRIHKLFTVIVVAGFLLFFYLKLLPAIDDIVLLNAVLIYLLISCFSLGAAFGIRISPVVRWSYFAGISLILFSDTIIALTEFTSYSALNFLILPTYYAAHITLTLALIRRMKTDY